MRLLKPGDPTPIRTPGDAVDISLLESSSRLAELDATTADEHAAVWLRRACLAQHAAYREFERFVDLRIIAEGAPAGTLGRILHRIEPLEIEAATALRRYRAHDCARGALVEAFAVARRCFIRIANTPIDRL